jgi:hypothetical protein
MMNPLIKNKILFPNDDTQAGDYCIPSSKHYGARAELHQWAEELINLPATGKIHAYLFPVNKLPSVPMRGGLRFQLIYIEDKSLNGSVLPSVLASCVNEQGDLCEKNMIVSSDLISFDDLCLRDTDVNDLHLVPVETSSMNLNISEYQSSGAPNSNPKSYKTIGEWLNTFPFEKTIKAFPKKNRKWAFNRSPKY